MLEIRPNCELCNKDLPPHSMDARICSYECTYCSDCVEHVLHNVCPTCGGGLSPRPVRPKHANGNQADLCLEIRPASQERVHSSWTNEEIGTVSQKLRNVPPEKR